MPKKLLLALIACLTMVQVWADEPFRNHRYDSFQATPVTNQSIVFIGNSITNMQPWAELFTAENVINRGNSGGFSWEILGNIQSYITQRPAKVFIMIGTNDMNTSGYTPEAVVANVRQTVKHIQKESPSTAVHVESVMASTNGSRTLDKVRELNRQLKAMATEMGVTFVDYFNATINIANNGGMAYDNLHPHVLGTRAWTEVVAPYVGTGVQPVLPASPTVNNGGQANSYGARTSVCAQLPVTSEDILFIGDEAIHSGEWQELLGNPHVKNRGTGWGRWGPDITYQTTCVPLFLKGLPANQQPKQVLLMIGTQNLTSSSTDVDAVKTKYEACIQAVRNNAPNTKITLVSEFPYGTSATSLNIRNLKPINQWLKEKAAATDNMDYCDVYSQLVDENDNAIAKYIDANQYVTGLGYQACARELAKHIDGCTVMTEAEAEAYYNLIAARKVLSNAIDAVELGGININLDEYYALLANNNATIAQLEAAGTALSNALRPQTGKWYTMTAKRNASVFFTKAATGSGFIASTALDNNSYWQLIERGDATYDLRNGAGYYAVPTATHNVQLNLSTDRPTNGWSLDNCDAVGAFNITAKVGTTAVNCCMNLTGSNLIYNWITGRAADTGCQVVFAEAEYTPTDQSDTYNVPFKRNTITNGQFTGEQWWYNVKIKNQFYLVDNGTDNYMSLNRQTVSTEQDEEWAFVGSDQKGYKIYNKKYGTAKLLAAPSTISNDNGSAYVKLVDAANIPAGYETRWQFAPSTNIADVDGYYMYSFGQESHKVNNYGELGKLSFWLGGAGAGSTLSFEFAEASLPVNLETGATYKNGTLATSDWVSQWKSTMTDPFQVIFGTSYNNMNASTMGIAVGQNSAPWTFTVSDQEYYIKSYSFGIRGGDANQVITPNGGTATSLNTSSFVTISWENNAKGQEQATFTYSGANKESALQNMVVVVRKSRIEPEPQFNVFEYGSTGNTVCYRIPAIATANNGDVIAVADYRYGGADIGFGRVSLRYRISKDNGQTWGDILTLQESVAGSYGVNQVNNLWAGFGDPCIVADRESCEVLIQSCCGNVSYPAGTWEHHQGIAQFRSYDNGATWEEYPDRNTNGITCRWIDVAEPIYQKFKDAGVTPAAMFIGSGRIFQSRFTKVGQYYRLYCVVLFRTASTGGLNYVLYSDDFGRNWELLGANNLTAGVTSGDEPKAEELPDGSILLSSRAQGRLYNIFHFTDVAKGEGKWMAQAQSMNSNNGICEQGGNPTNGEIFLLPVKRKADNKKMWMALQSVPFGNGRANVGIYYKALKSYADYNNPDNFAKDWDGRHQSSYIGSAYSTITLQHNNTIGFLYEEATFGRDFTIVYKNYTIEQITNDEYELDIESPIAPFDLTKDGIDLLTESLTFSDYLGGLKEEAHSMINDAIASFKANPTQENYINVFKVIDAAPANELDVTKLYIIRNTTRGSEGAYAMCVSSASEKKLKTAAYNASDVMQQWGIEPCGIEGQDEWYYLYNKGTQTYVMNLLAKETAMYTTDDKTQAGLYKLQQINGDHFAMVNKNPTDTSVPAIHAPGDYTTRMVCWTTVSNPSQWFFEPTNINSGYTPTGIIETENSSTIQTAYDLQGRAIAAPKQGLYIINRKKVIVK